MKHIPNFLTCLNLLCGCVGIVFAFEGNLVWSAYMVGIAAVLDFLDGFVARLLNVKSEIGKQLDSLADMVTFGVLPGVVMYQLITMSFILDILRNTKILDDNSVGSEFIIPYVAFLIPVFSALRLAKFNLDSRQTDSFIGLPTPASAIMICSLALILNINYININIPALTELSKAKEFVLFIVRFFDHESLQNLIILNKYFLIVLTVIVSLLLVAPIPLFALKFTSFSWKGNEIRYAFLISCLVLILLFGYAGIPFSVVLYLILSLINNLMAKKA